MDWTGYFSHLRCEKVHKKQLDVYAELKKLHGQQSFHDILLNNMLRQHKTAELQRDNGLELFCLPANVYERIREHMFVLLESTFFWHRMDDHAPVFEWLNCKKLEMECLEYNLQ